MVEPRGTTHSSLNQTKCIWAPTERCCSPVEVVLSGRSVALAGFAEIFRMHPHDVDMDGID